MRSLWIAQTNKSKVVPKKKTPAPHGWPRLALRRRSAAVSAVYWPCTELNENLLLLSTAHLNEQFAYKRGVAGPKKKATGINYCQNGRLAKAKVTLVLEAKKEALARRILQVRQLPTPPGTCLIDNATILNAMCDALLP